MMATLAFNELTSIVRFDNWKTSVPHYFSGKVGIEINSLNIRSEIWRRSLTNSKINHEKFLYSWVGPFNYPPDFALVVCYWSA